MASVWQDEVHPFRKSGHCVVLVKKKKVNVLPFMYTSKLHLCFDKTFTLWYKLWLLFLVVTFCPVLNEKTQIVTFCPIPYETLNCDCLSYPLWNFKLWLFVLSLMKQFKLLLFVLSLMKKFKLWLFLLWLFVHLGQNIDCDFLSGDFLSI